MKHSTREAKCEAAAQEHDLAVSRWEIIHAVCDWRDPANAWGLAELERTGLALAKQRAALLGLRGQLSGGGTLANMTRAEFAQLLGRKATRQLIQAQ